jgi:pyroglutamyl-peptidase
MKIVQDINGAHLNGYAIIGKVLPVDFNQSGKQVIEYIEEINPNAIILLGVAARRTAITGANCNKL